MKVTFYTSLLITYLLFSTNTYADTFGKVVNILNTNCAFSACHSAETEAAGLNLSGDKQQIYNAIVNQKAVNAVAQEKNHSLVTPGDPSKSFLYRKMNYDLHNDSKLTEGENQLMPIGNKMANEDIELVRQWILYGALLNNKEYVKYETLKEYYEDPSAQLPQIDAPPAPAAGQGYQLQLGPIFLEPNQEVEYVYRYELRNDEEQEVYRVGAEMNQQSHHFLFFKFDEDAKFDQKPGLLKVGTNDDDAFAITNNSKMLGGWAYSKDVTLPKGTAYKWSKNEVLKLNYHILNYSSSAILPAKLYVNVYTQPVGTAIKEMHSEFHLSPEGGGSGIIFPPGISNHQWHMNHFDETRGNEEVHLWSIGSHTHKYGVDFDMYLYENKIKGEQVYEGFYNLDYSFNQGFYSFSEPPFRMFDNFLTVNSDDGLWLEGVYDNTSDNFVSVGLTTKDEMFGVFIQYLTGDISQLTTVDVAEIDATINWTIHPNPTNNGFVNIQLPNNIVGEKLLKIYNTLGSEVLAKPVGKNETNIKLNLTNQTAGYYFVELTTTESKSVHKLLLK